jgi:DNA-binding NarL/FixJ family response regulator
MSAPAAVVHRAEPIRIFVSATNEARRAALAARVAAAGHPVAMTPADADIVLSDEGEGMLAIFQRGHNGEPSGLIAGDADVAQIKAAIAAVAAGLIVRGPELVDPGFRMLDEPEGQRLLTPREIEVLGAVREGLTNKEIARRLDISLHTVKFHIESIFRKLEVTTRTGAIAKAASLHTAHPTEL